MPSLKSLKLGDYQRFFPLDRAFKMGMLNIVSLPKYIDEIRIILADQYFDVFALNETRLDKNTSNQDMSIYKIMISSERTALGREEAFAVKNSINYLNRNDLHGWG